MFGSTNICELNGYRYGKELATGSYQALCTHMIDQNTLIEQSTSLNCSNKTYTLKPSLKNPGYSPGA